MATVKKTGVYRHKDGTAVYLVEGESFPDEVMDAVEFDAGASKDRLEAKEPDRFAYVKNAPQDQKAEDTWSGRALSGAPENKAMKAPASNRSDAELADSSAKAKS